MNIPFVIDNQQHKMADVLNALLADHKGHSLDIATAYFNVSGWQLLRDALNGLGNFRLLLGDEPEVGSDLGLHEVGAKPIKGLISDLAKETFNIAVSSSTMICTGILPGWYSARDALTVSAQVSIH